MIYHYLNENFITETEINISPFDLGLLRGYGVFDYVQVYEGKPFHLFDHLKRLKWSADQIELPLPKSLEEIEDLALQLIVKNPPIDAGIRFIITGGLCGKDFLLPSCSSTFIMLFHPYVSHPPRYYSKGMRAVTASLERTNPCVKSTNYTPAVLAMKKAFRASADEAIYLNSSQELLEATTSNLFFFKDGSWFTANDDQVVNGVTRSIFLKLAQSQYRVELRSLHISEIETCEEAFLCSSVKDAIPLVQIDDKFIGNGLPGPHTARMRQFYHTYQENYFSETFEIVSTH